MHKTLLEEGSPKKRLTIQLNEYNNYPFLDIRYWYYDKSVSEMKPSKKGIALGKKNLLFLIKAIFENQEKIFDHMGESYVPKSVKKYDNLQSNYLDNIYNSFGIISSEEKENSVHETFFSIEHRGGLDTVVYNKSNEFVNELFNLLNNTLEGKLIKEMFNALLISYDKAKRKYDNMPISSSSILFEGLEFNWTKFLYQFIKGE